MKKTGEILRAAREQKGVTINEVALVTKINAKTIELMEAGNVDSLPQKAFLRGFVQTYARYLGLDQKEILNLFQEEMGSIRPSLPGTGTLPTKEESTSAALRGVDSVDPADRMRMFLMIGVGIVLVAAIFVVFQLVQKYEEEATLPPSTTTTTLMGAIGDTMTSGSSLDVTGQIEGTEATSSSSTSSSSSSSSTSSTSTTTLKTTTTSTSKPTTTSTTTTSTTSRSTTTTVTTTSRTTSTTKGKVLEVILEALDNVTIEYKIDGGPQQKTTLGPDQVKVLRGTSALELKISDGGAVNVIRNGLDLGVPGTLGKPVTIKFP